MNRTPSEPTHRISRAESKLAETLVAQAINGSVEPFEAIYVDANLNKDYAARVDIIAVMVIVTRASLNFGPWRRFFRMRRTELEYETILQALQGGPFGEIIDVRTAADFLRWGCRLGDEELPTFEANDVTTKTYVAVAAASLLYTVGLVNWKRRIRAIRRVARFQYEVLEKARIPPDGERGGQ